MKPSLSFPRALRATFGLAVAAFGVAAFAADNGDPPVSSGFHFSEKDGETLYQGVCQGCHMPLAQGVATGAGAYPALKANPRLAAAAYPIYNIVHGRNGMPAVGQFMSDEQVAEVVNYVRTHFDNHYDDVVSAEDVKRLR